MSCKGLCDKYKATSAPNMYRYLNGQKRCGVCEMFLDWKGLRCPCCGSKLRTRPRILNYDKSLFREIY